MHLLKLLLKDVRERMIKVMKLVQGREDLLDSASAVGRTGAQTLQPLSRIGLTRVLNNLLRQDASTNSRSMVLLKLK